MRIDSRILDIPRDVLKSIDTGNAGGRQVQHTSEPEGGNTAPVRHDTFGVSNTPSRVTVPKPTDVKEAVEKLNRFVQSQQKHVNFSVDEATHSTVIKVFKTETGELIKQFPPEEILAMAARIRQNIGWLVDSKV
jgi:flagellar protein FlaG